MARWSRVVQQTSSLRKQGTQHGLNRGLFGENILNDRAPLAPVLRGEGPGVRDQSAKRIAGSCAKRRHCAGNAHTAQLDWPAAQPPSSPVHRASAFRPGVHAGPTRPASIFSAPFTGLNYNDPAVYGSGLGDNLCTVRTRHVAQLLQRNQPSLHLAHQGKPPANISGGRRDAVRRAARESSQTRRRLHP